MSSLCFRAVALFALACLSAERAQSPALRIVSPKPDDVLAGNTVLEAAITPGDVVPQTVTFFMDGHPACTFEHKPLRCTWEGDQTVRSHHLRVVATLADGGRLV